MTRHAVVTALTLYGAGTLTAAQAASRAGVTEERFATLRERFGVRPSEPDVPAAGHRPASAD
ncbi:DUF7317 family protein [Halorarum salinum]|uniref:HTH araC/xylS-type domain-containing protein n=1 Tax=Halorarum salinum TaxID=2743089 RepID=A0A7D5L8X2_9EURY|nr:hypothetical protein [Halobaculum salinum]QLG60854.1 hypothetical protein HUG12_03470 [Halobaculum salinum]